MQEIVARPEEQSLEWSCNGGHALSWHYACYPMIKRLWDSDAEKKWQKSEETLVICLKGQDSIYWEFMGGLLCFEVSQRSHSENSKTQCIDVKQTEIIWGVPSNALTGKATSYCLMKHSFVWTLLYSDVWLVLVTAYLIENQLRCESSAFEYFAWQRNSLQETWV